MSLNVLISLSSVAGQLYSTLSATQARPLQILPWVTKAISHV